jgi:hypothetical protein
VWLLAVVLALAVLGGCTFLTNFDPEGQPCDPGTTVASEQCLTDAGYRCVGGLCTRDAGK